MCCVESSFEENLVPIDSLSWKAEVTQLKGFQDIPESVVLVTQWSGLVRGGIFVIVDDDLGDGYDDIEGDVDDVDDDDNGVGADRLITLTVTSCPLLRIGEKAVMLSHTFDIMIIMLSHSWSALDHHLYDHPMEASGALGFLYFINIETLGRKGPLENY